MKLAFFFFASLLIFSEARAHSLDSLAHSSEWLHLLHMRKAWMGHYQSSVKGNGFFLSSEGSENPHAELQETVRQMFESDESTESKTQCQFLARREFLLRKGPSEWQSKIQKCQFSSEWLSKLNTTKISLIFAAGYMNSAGSSFGHTFLKLQNPDNVGGKELLDYGINFAARTADTQGALYALYGLAGFFPGTFAMTPYHQMIKEYTHLEGRDLWEYELDFTPDEVQRVLYHLLELDHFYFDYYFLDDNCSYQLLKILEVGRPGLQLAKDEEFFVIPIDSVKEILPLTRAVHYRPSVETEWRQRKETLNSEQLQELRSLNPSTSPQELARFDVDTLSAAQYLVALKGFDNHELWKKTDYEISKERARRREKSETFHVQRHSESPDQGADSSAVTLGFLDQKNSYLLSGFRFAFHDQLSRNVGVSPFSHLEVMGFQWQTSNLWRTWLRHYRLLEALSTQSVNSFEAPLSWGVVLGGDSDLENPMRLRHKMMGEIGYSLELWPEKIRWANLLLAGVGQDSDFNIQLAPGFDSRVWLFWTPGIRTLLQYQSLRFPSKNLEQLSAFQAIDLTKQLELRFGWQSFEEGSSLKIEKSVFLMQNFLF